MTEGPTTRRRQLGFRLFALREESGLTAEEAGKRAGVSKATVSRYERAKGAVRWNQVDQLCRVYGASDAERGALVELAKNSKVTDGWWVPRVGTASLGMLIALEDEATRIRQFASNVVPGLLQTREYARAIKATPGAHLPSDEIDGFLDTRMRRQRLLDPPGAPTYEVVLDEAVLRRAVGEGAVMASQLEFLAERGQASNTTVQVLPFHKGAYAAAQSSFMIIGSCDPALDVVYTESSGGSLYLEEPEELRLCSDAFDYLSAQALPPDLSAELIAEASKTHLRT
jgi:transcriptional regulator with XRE-family HTH domain